MDTEDSTRKIEPESLESVLMSDVIRLAAMSNGGSMEKRNLVRAAFAAIEGFLWKLQGELLNTALGNELSEAERGYLREDVPWLTEKGEVKTKTSKTTLKQRVYLTAKLVARMRPECVVDLNAEAWHDLLRSLDLRHRLTHPKTVEDMEVSQEELRQTISGLGFFTTQLVSTLREGLAAYRDSSYATVAQLLKALRDFEASKAAKAQAQANAWLNTDPNDP
jgi:hypothetical protein